jgi:hypothetical protein
MIALFGIVMVLKVTGNKECVFISGVHFAGLLGVQNILSADAWQTESHSFSDHLISGPVSVTPSSVIEASIVLCSVSL